MSVRKYQRRRHSSPKRQVLPVKGWPRGLDQLVNPNQIRNDELAEAVNVAYTQYGVLAKRAGTELIVDLGSSVQGFGVLNKADGVGGYTRYFLAVANGVLYRIDPVTKTKTTILGFTFHATNRVVIRQGGLPGDTAAYIFDGYNRLVKWDGTSFHQFTEILKPTGLGVSKVGSATGPKTISYVISASNEVDETDATAAVQLTSAPEKWDTSTYASLTWSPSTGATSYNIYKGSPGNETLLTTVSETTFFDQGQADASQSFTTLPPSENRTGGPVFRTGTVYHDSIIGVEKDRPERVWASAGGDKIDSFAPGDGGIWFDYHPDTGEAVNDVAVFSALNEDSVYLLKDHKIGKFRFNADGSPSISDINLAVGGLAPVLFENDMAFLSRYGLYTLRQEPNLVNTLRIAELSVRVHPTYINSIKQSALPKVCGIYDKANHVMVYSIPSGSVNNNTSLAYDPVYLGFSEYRGIKATAFSTFVDDNNDEYSYGGDETGKVFRLFSGTSDMGQTIFFRAATKLFDMDAPYAFKRFRRAYYIFGNIAAQNLKVSLIQDGVEVLDEFSVASQQGDTGWGADLWGDILWGDSSGTPVSTNNRSVMRYSDIKKDLFSLQVTYENNSSTDTFEILGLYLEWQPSRKKPPSEFKISS
jgi:hypothetical protein